MQRVLQKRLKTVSEGKGIDWACAESLAFASLLNEGINVRLSDKIVEEGLFLKDMPS